MFGISLKFCTIALLALTLNSGCKKKGKLDDNFHLQSVGESARDLLTSEDFSRLTVEVQYITGYEPSTSALNTLKSFMEQRLNKPEGITITQTQITSPGKNFFSVADVIEVEENHRTSYSTGNRLTCYLLLADG